MAVPTKAPGKITTCMGKARTPGAMEESMRESTIWIRSTATASTIGQMGEDMKATGKMESSMVKASTFYLPAL